MSEDDQTVFATRLVRHAAILRDRHAELRGRPVRRKPECVVIGHSWTTDPGREGWVICIACDVVRKD